MNHDHVLSPFRLLTVKHTNALSYISCSRLDNWLRHRRTELRLRGAAGRGTRWSTQKLKQPDDGLEGNLCLFWKMTNGGQVAELAGNNWSFVFGRLETSCGKSRGLDWSSVKTAALSEPGDWMRNCGRVRGLRQVGFGTRERVNGPGTGSISGPISSGRFWSVGSILLAWGFDEGL